MAEEKTEQPKKAKPEGKSKSKNVKGKKAARKGKSIRKGRKHQSIKMHVYYEVKGDKLERKRKFCPKCGDGSWLSIHKSRVYCGGCGYTELDKRKPSG